MSGFQLQRLGLIMEPEPGNPLEVEGTLNPAAARGPDGQLYLFPRLVASGNYSRIGNARVQFNQAGDPCGVERLGIAIEPETDYELRPDGRGGCEDPRVTEAIRFKALRSHRRGIVRRRLGLRGVVERAPWSKPFAIQSSRSAARRRPTF